MFNTLAIFNSCFYKAKVKALILKGSSSIMRISAHSHYLNRYFIIFAYYLSSKSFGEEL